MEALQELLTQYSWLLGVLALIGIELSPIKFNPIQLLGRLIGAWLGFDKVSKDLAQLKKEVDLNELDRIKYEILQFSGSLRNGLKRTEVDYLHIESIFTKYKNKGGNTYIMHEMEYIRECHDKGMIL